MKKLMILLMVLALSIVLAGTAYAHYLDFSAANTNGRVVYEYNGNLTQKYREYSNRAVREWNEEKNVTNSANWPSMNQKNSNNTATLNVGACLSGCDTALGFYQHYPGPKEDIIRLDQSALNQYRVEGQQKVVTHEFGHSGGLDHNNVGCAFTVMGGPNAPCETSFIMFPGSHDRNDVNNSPRLWGTNDFARTYEERTVLDKEYYDNGDVASKTVAYPNGSIRISEYRHKTH
jgi:hypothetical protein